MFLKEFHFEKNIAFRSPEDKIRFRKWVQKLADANLQVTHRKEILERNCSDRNPRN